MSFLSFSTEVRLASLLLPLYRCAIDVLGLPVYLYVGGRGEHAFLENKGRKERNFDSVERRIPGCESEEVRKGSLRS